MYDSDGMGFFAIGILMMVAVYGFVKVFLDNIIWFFLIMGVIAAWFWFDMKNGLTFEKATLKWWRGNINKVLFKLFGVTIYDKHIWPIYSFLSIITRMAFSFLMLILGLYFVAFLLEQI